jgi:CubicO group peptidase (beta-lactamase class C family)
VVYRGRIIGERYATEDGINWSTRLAGWSMTKSVMSTLIGLRIGDGLLQLKQDYLMPSWRLHQNDARAKITLDQLLRMSRFAATSYTHTRPLASW